MSDVDSKEIQLQLGSLVKLAGNVLDRAAEIRSRLQAVEARLVGLPPDDKSKPGFEQTFPADTIAGEIEERLQITLCHLGQMGKSLDRF